MARVLVTGAGGFIGQHLIKVLASRDYNVAAAIRHPVSHLYVPAQGNIIVTGELEEADWRQILNGVDFVVHLAACVHRPQNAYPGETQVYHRVNVLGTIRLAEAAAAAGVTRIVFLSSVKAVGEGSLDPHHVYTEADPCTPQDLYGKSKRDAELALRRIADTGQLKVTVLRPPLVYGPGVKANFLSLLKAVDKGMPLPLAAVRNRRSVIFAGNLVDAIERSLHEGAGRQPFETFFVSDDEHVSTPDLIRRIARHLGRPVRLFPMPVSLLRFAAKILGKERAIDSLTASLVVDTSAIRSALSWRPIYSLDDGLAETAAWYRNACAAR